MILVKIKGTVMTSQYGTLTTGTILRTNEAFAKHLVEEAFAADYVTVKIEDEGVDVSAGIQVKKRGRPAKE